MPIIRREPKVNVEKQQEALKNLEIRLGNKKIMEEYIFQVEGEYETDEGPAMLAFAELKNGSYAIYAPKYLSEKQLVVFEFLLREVDEKDQLLVFSQRDYEAVKKYSYGKNVNVKILR